MTTRDELLRAVVADPDADAPREAFAAWGFAHGDLQGRLARVQLDEVRERRTGTVDAARRLSLEAYDLIQQNREAWASDVLAIAPQSQPQFVRGFVEVVVLDVPTFLARPVSCTLLRRSDRCSSSMLVRTSTRWLRRHTWRAWYRSSSITSRCRPRLVTQVCERSLRRPTSRKLRYSALLQ